MSLLREGLAAALASAAIQFAVTANAMSFPQFDKMSTSGQAEFIADLVDRTEKALKDEGKAELAMKVEQLFADIKPGDKMSLGLAELERNVARARLADVHRLEKDPKAPLLDVEDALFVTLQKNGIELSSNAMNGVINALASFHSMTNAEFHAQSPVEQRRVIKLFAALAFPDYCFRDMLKSKQNAFLDLSDEHIRDLENIMKTQFPASGEQPGFADVASQVETDRRKAPDHAGPFLSLMDYILNELETRIAVHEKKLDERSVLLPDGRHVYHDKDGVFWVFPKGATEYKLEANLQPLAQRLRRCMESGGFTDGARAQAACRDEVAAPSPVPKTAPRPAANADDPLGPGGYITPYRP
jgi:hypothetical protein